MSQISFLRFDHDQELSADLIAFPLIVAAMAVSAGWLEQQWLVILALALTFSFVIAAAANDNVHSLYARLESRLYRFQSKTRLPVDIPPDLGGAEILVAGMGRVGTGAYETIGAKRSLPGRSATRSEELLIPLVLR